MDDFFSLRETGDNCGAESNAFIIMQEKKKKNAAAAMSAKMLLCGVVFRKYVCNIFGKGLFICPLTKDNYCMRPTKYECGAF